MADRKTGSRPGAGTGPRQDKARRPAKARGRAASAPHLATETQSLAFGRRNWILLGSGVIAVLAGFGFLAAGDITVAPVLLLAGYLVLIPMGLVAGSFGDDEGDARTGPDEERGAATHGDAG